MASRYFGISRGERTVTEGSSTTSKHFEAVLDLTKSFTKSEFLQQLDNIFNTIITGNFPAYSTNDVSKSWYTFHGKNANLVTAAFPAAATGTVTCASALEADTVTLDGTVLTAQDGREKFTVVCRADSAGDLNNRYFTFSKDGTDYYAWFNVNSAGVDPVLAGKTAVPVAIATNAANTAVASALNTAIDNLAGISSTVSSATVTVVIDAIGAVTDAADGGAVTGFTITVTRQGASTPSANEFFMNTSDTATAASLVLAIGANATTAAKFTATSALGVVTLTAKLRGTGGNALTLVSSHITRLAVSAATMLLGAAVTLGDLRVTLLSAGSFDKTDLLNAMERVKDHIITRAGPPD